LRVCVDAPFRLYMIAGLVGALLAFPVA